MASIKGVPVSESQANTIDSLLVTHRELMCVDLVKYSLSRMAKGGLWLYINSDEYWYAYKILASGAITEMRKGDTEFKQKNISYFN